MKNSRVSYIRYSPDKARRELTDKLVTAYRDVFASAPWNEWRKCSVCEKYWGIKDEAWLQSLGLRHCDAPLVDFWPRDTVEADLRHEITPKSSCWLAVIGDSVIGFTLGYPAKLGAIETKLGVPIQAKFRQYFGLIQKLAYQDEVGVVEQFRGQKIAKALIARRHEDFLRQGLQVGVVRTRELPEPSVTYLWYTQKLGFKTLARYDDGRIVLARELAGLKALLHV